MNRATAPYRPTRGREPVTEGFQVHRTGPAGCETLVRRPSNNSSAAWRRRRSRSAHQRPDGLAPKERLAVRTLDVRPPIYDLVALLAGVPLADLVHSDDPAVL